MHVYIYVECGPEEQFDPCNSHCQVTCAKRRADCQGKCVPGCICKDWYIRDDKTNLCISMDACP